MMLCSIGLPKPAEYINIGWRNKYKHTSDILCGSIDLYLSDLIRGSLLSFHLHHLCVLL